MHLLRLLAEVMPVEPSIGHMFYDIGLGAGVALLGGAKLMEMGKEWGLLPDKKNNSYSSGNGSRYMYSKLDDIAEKLDKQVELSIKMVTILEMRNKQ